MNILDFEKHYPDAKVVRLEQNYRSTKNILEAANAVIANNEGRRKKTLWTSGKEGAKLGYRQLESSVDEARFVAEDIRKRVADGEYRYGDCAILMRTNVQSKEFEDAFRLLGIDYDLVKGLRFWDTKVIKDLTSYLLTVASGQNDMRTLRIINLPPRGIGTTSIEKIRAFSFQNEMSMMEACIFHADSIPGLGRSLAKVKDFTSMICSLRERMEELSYSELLDEIISVTGYDRYIKDEAETDEKYIELKDYIDKLKEALDVYEESENEPDLIDFMRQNGVEGNNIDASSDGGVIRHELSEEEERELREKKVLIMTMHNAKGLEFPNVYLVGMEEGLFPGYVSIFSEDPEEIEEERRLCYVAITRAKERLTLLSARHRMVNGETRYSKTSRFVKEIPLELVDINVPDKGFINRSGAVSGAGGLRGISGGVLSNSGGVLSNSGGALSRSGSSLSPAGNAFSPIGTGGKKVNAIRQKKSNVYSDYAKAVKGSQIGSTGELPYKVGDRVKHIKFGEGTVRSIRDRDRDKEVTVEFDSYGTKIMYAGFAKLVKV